MERFSDGQRPVVDQWAEDLVEVRQGRVAGVRRCHVFVALQQKVDGSLVILVCSLTEPQVGQDMVESVTSGALFDALVEIVGSSTNDQDGHLVVAQHARLLQGVVQLLLVPILNDLQHLSSLAAHLAQDLCVHVCVQHRKE